MLGSSVFYLYIVRAARLFNIPRSLDFILVSLLHPCANCCVLFLARAARLLISALLDFYINSAAATLHASSHLKCDEEFDVEDLTVAKI
jgi:hypothetical protein